MAWMGYEVGQRKYLKVVKLFELMSLDKKNFALAGGILWGASMFALTWTAYLFNYGEGLMYWLENAYFGYTVTPLGSVIGAVWGFVDMFIGGYLFASIYNWLNSRK